MKKIIIGIFVFVLLFAGQKAFANVTWNTDPTDCPGSGIGIDGGVGVPPPNSNDCWNLTSVYGSPGDSVNIQLYYHNTGNQPATDTKVYIHVTPSLGTPSTTHTFKSSLSADPTGTALGTTTLHLQTAQSLSIGPNDTWWYPNQTTSNPIKSGAQITTSSGLYLGTINNGWLSQGSVVSAFKVGNTSTPPQNCTIDTFYTNGQTINQGSSATLSWYTTGCTTVKLNNSPVALDGSQVVSPTSTTTYTLKAYNSAGFLSDTENVTITVNANIPNCTVNSFTANPGTITVGQSSILSWSTSNCTNVTISNLGYNVPTSGNQDVYPTQTTTYTLTAHGSNGTTQTKTTTVTVTPITPTCTLNSFTANPGTITVGQSSTLSWNTSNCSYVKIYKGSTLIGTYSGSTAVVTPSTKTVYTAKAYSSSGVLGGTMNATVLIGNIIPTPQNCVINSFTAIPSIIPSGQSSTLSWTTSNCNYTRITMGQFGSSINRPQDGSLSVSPTQTTTYTLTAYGSNGVIQTKTTKVTVNNTVAPSCEINNFSANPTSIKNGQSSVLTWNTSNCTTVSLGTAEVVPTSGTKKVYPVVTTTYTLTAKSANGMTVSRSVTIYVNTINPQPKCTIDAFNANPTSINIGDSSRIAWKTTGCIDISITAVGSNLSADGDQYIYPTQTKIYTLKAKSVSGDIQTRSVTVYVDAIVPTPVCTINNFSASPTSITSGESSTLSWDTTDCTNIIISGLGYNVPLSGSQEVWPTHTTTYTLSVRGVNGGSQSKSVTVYVNTANPDYCTINNFSASPASITSGDYSTLSWDTTDCTTVKLGGSLVANSSTKKVWPTNTTTYTLTAYGSNGITQTDYVTVYVNQTNYDTCEIVDFEASDTSIEEGDSSTLSWDTNNCDHVTITELGNVNDSGSDDVYPTSDKTYVLTAYDVDGSHLTDSIRIYVDENNNNNYDDCRIDSFTASDTYIERGDDVELRWRTSDCDNVSISGIGNVSDDGEEDVRPSRDTTYTLRAYGNGGSETESIRINVDYYNNNNNYYGYNQNYNQFFPPAPVYNTNVITTVATNISQTSAQVNGLITSPNYSGATTYFEYGTEINLGLRTAPRSTSGNTNFSEYLTGLNPKTIYYFRAVSEGPNGVSFGAIEVFQTLGYQNTNTNTVQTIRQVVYQQGTTIAESESPVVLRIENKYQTIGVGDTVDYVVFYKNISNQTLTRPMVQVFIPKGLTLLNSSRGTYSIENRIMSAPIEDLYPNAEGVIYLQARVDSLDPSLAQIVTTAVLIYTTPNGAQENAMAYVLNNPRLNNLLGASAFSGRLFGMNLIEWLFLIVLIMLAVLIARSYSGRRSGAVSQTGNHI